MDWNYNVTLQNRKLLSKFLEKFSLDQLNKIPEGYRNSVFWNIAHTIVTQQLLVYGLSNTPFLIKVCKVTRWFQFIILQDYLILIKEMIFFVKIRKESHEKILFFEYL